MPWRIRGRDLPLRPVPLLMGVVNVTPDSFSDGGDFLDTSRAVAHGRALAEAGAAILDVGGESTRPGADPVEVQVELDRTIPVVEALARETGAAISIDTTKADVAGAALDAGAAIVNDVSALRFGLEIAALAAERGAGLVLMHMKGTPRTMQDDPRYTDLVGEIGAELGAAADRAMLTGVGHDAIVLDPGIGFGKTAGDNLRLLAAVPRLAALGYPILVGHSRKSFLDPAKRRPPRERGPESLAAGLLAAINGAAILRVHDVEAHARALEVYARYLAAAREAETP
jgi:dihydropteroate synthase